MQNPATHRTSAPKTAMIATRAGEEGDFAPGAGRFDQIRAVAGSFQQNSQNPQNPDSTAKQNPEDQREELRSPQSGSPANLPASPTPIVTANINGAANAPSKVTPITKVEVATVIHHTVEATERLRTSGNNQLEVKVQLESGQELTIQLQVVEGEIKPTFRTDSESLRAAIEQNWSQFSKGANERGVKLTSAVFESDPQAGMPNQQQPQEGKERPFTPGREEFSEALTPRSETRRSMPPRPSRPQTSGVQLYA